MVTIRSRAPLRIGLAGGGTDIAEYSDVYGGCVFNSTIGMYCYCTLRELDTPDVIFNTGTPEPSLHLPAAAHYDTDGSFKLQKGVYNYFVSQFNNGKPLPMEMTTSCDAPFGSGLGTSSTLVVAMIEAYDRLLRLGLSNSQKAELAYDIERKDLKLSGGKQDQYAAVYGGFNFIEFKQNGTTVVNQLRMPSEIIDELESSLFIYYSGTPRDSDAIISQQIKNTVSQNKDTIEAMHNLKKYSVDMKDAVLAGDFSTFAYILNKSWEDKKKTSNSVTNEQLDSIIEFASKNGSEAVKVSGAGGGGFILLYCNPVNRAKLQTALKKLRGEAYPVKFSKKGAQSWRVGK